MNADDLFNTWLIHRYWEKLERTAYLDRKDNEMHLFNCGFSVKSSDVTWDCGCYSSWTRDDWVSTKASYVCRCERGMIGEFDYGRSYSLPQIIEELLSDRAGYLADACSVEARS